MFIIVATYILNYNLILFLATKIINTLLIEQN